MSTFESFAGHSHVRGRTQLTFLYNASDAFLDMFCIFLWYMSPYHIETRVTCLLAQLAVLTFPFVYPRCMAVYGRSLRTYSVLCRSLHDHFGLVHDTRMFSQQPVVVVTYRLIAN